MRIFVVGLGLVVEVAVDRVGDAAAAAYEGWVVVCSGGFLRADGAVVAVAVEWVLIEVGMEVDEFDA